MLLFQGRLWLTIRMWQDGPAWHPNFIWRRRGDGTRSKLRVDIVKSVICNSWYFLWSGQQTAVNANLSYVAIAKTREVESHANQCKLCKSTPWSSGFCSTKVYWWSLSGWTGANKKLFKMAWRQTLQCKKLFQILFYSLPCFVLYWFMSWQTYGLCCMKKIHMNALS